MQGGVDANRHGGQSGDYGGKNSEFKSSRQPAHYHFGYGPCSDQRVTQAAMQQNISNPAHVLNVDGCIEAKYRLDGLALRVAIFNKPHLTKDHIDDVPWNKSDSQKNDNGHQQQRRYRKKYSPYEIAKHVSPTGTSSRYVEFSFWG